jgi:hypothetical protein
MLSRRDLSGLAVDDKAKRDYKQVSNRYWKAHIHMIDASQATSHLSADLEKQRLRLSKPTVNAC